MPTETYSFRQDLNQSLQVGDLIYFVNPRENKNNSFLSGSNTPFYNALTYLDPEMPTLDNKPKKLGIVTMVNFNSRTIDVEVPAAFTTWDVVPTPNTTYFLFSKDKRANTSGIIGYYAETEIRNYTTRKAEIFTLNLDFVESSK